MSKLNLQLFLSSGVLLAAISSFASAPEPSSARLSGYYSFKFDTKSLVEEDRGQASLLGIKSLFDISFIISEEFRLKVKPSLLLSSGQVQSDIEAFQSQNQITLQSAFLDWQSLNHPMNYSIQFGALNPADKSASLITGQSAFLGLSARAQTLTSANAIGLQLQSLLTASSTASTERVKPQSPPAFQSAEIYYQLNPKNYSDFFIALGQYAYHDLSSSEAKDAQLYGNSVETISLSERQFRYNFSGNYLRANLESLLLGYGRLKLNLSAAQNNLAPTGLNSAWASKIGFTTNLNSLNKGLKLTPSIERFYIEPDATVAQYNSIYSFGSNRNGLGLEVAFDFTKQDLKLILGSRQAELIYKDPYQSLITEAYITLETSYVSI